MCIEFSDARGCFFVLMVTATEGGIHDCVFLEFFQKGTRRVGGWEEVDRTRGHT